jgi:F-type H+-transporting ATPase subunit alpha
MVEILKQDQYRPMPVAEQVLVLFSGTRGYLDDVALPAVKKFETGLLRFVKDKYANLLADIARKGELDAELEKRAVSAITEFKRGFDGHVEVK